jgi:hypothetical protein
MALSGDTGLDKFLKVSTFFFKVLILIMIACRMLSFSS